MGKAKSTINLHLCCLDKKRESNACLSLSLSLSSQYRERHGSSKERGMDRQDQIWKNTFAIADLKV